jgi:pimeloyl-ACP methyl ester carboxylesterase
MAYRSQIRGYALEHFGSGACRQLRVSMHADVGLNRDIYLGKQEKVARLPARYFTLPSGNCLCFSEYGDTDGLPVIYFHDLANSRLEAKLLARAASDAGLRIIAVDRPGVGGSTFNMGTLATFSHDLECLLQNLRVYQYCILSSGLGLSYALEHAGRNPNKVLAISVLSAGRSSLLSIYALTPSPMRGAVTWLLNGLLKVRYRRFIGNPTQYFERYRETLCYADRRVLNRRSVQDSMLDNVREANAQGTRGFFLDLKLCTETMSSRYAHIHSKVDFWSGALDGHSQSKLKALGLRSTTFHSLSKCGECFHLRYINVVFEQLRAVSGMQRPGRVVKAGKAEREAASASVPEKQKARA